MRYFLVLLIGLFSFQISNSQIYELGVFAGGSNFIGDVGATNYISPNQLAIGGIFKWNRSPRHAFRASVIYSELQGIDSKSDDPRRVLRDYAFNNNLLEVSLGLEFTFFDFNLHDLSSKGTPYLYTGITTARHDNFFFDSGGNLISVNANSWAFGIPMALGYKALISPHIVVAAEIGARYTFSDEIDGSLPTGNTNNNDWYVFSGITLTYTFGQKPCYCNF